MPAPLPLEIDAATAAALFAGGAMLLDVREPMELANYAVAGATHVPMQEVPAALDQLPRDRDVLVLCHSGVRSLMVTRFLRAQGLERTANVAGGVIAWAQLPSDHAPRT